jgi:hypothetical protein
MALACCLVVGGAAAAIFVWDDDPAPEVVAAVAVAHQPVANRDGKSDRLAVASAAAPVIFPDPLRQSLATDSPVNVPMLASVPPVADPPLPPRRPKAADQTIQKSYSLLSDMQIAALKGRLQLTPAQQPYWPAVESALREVAQKIHARRTAGAHANLDSSDIQQIKTAAAPLLTKLREDQKREARSLARIIGLEAVASLI